MDRKAERKRADELKAADAVKVLEKMPTVLAALKMKPEQLDQVQRFLDAQVVNPVIEKEYKELDKKTIRSVSGSLEHRWPEDSPEVRRRNQKATEYIRLGDQDKRILLDVNKLLARDALTPETDNPDEAGYHIRVRNTLAARGVWLRLDRRSPAAVERPGSLPENDPKRYSFALSVGPEGSVIPTTTGLVTRDDLRKTNLFSIDYSEHVHFGPTKKFLESAITKLQVQAQVGWSHHYDYTGHSVVGRPVTEWKAGVKLPDIRMWQVARTNLMQASEHLRKGRFMAALQHIEVAALMITVAEQALAHYMREMAIAAEKIVGVLQVAEKAGEIAGYVMIIRSVGMRILGAVTVDGVPIVATQAGAGGGAAATRATTKTARPPASDGAASGARPDWGRQFRPPTQPPGKIEKSPVATQQGNYPTNYHGRQAYEETLRERHVYEAAVKEGNRTLGSTINASSSGGANAGGNFVSNRQVLAQIERNKAYHEEFLREMREYHKKHPFEFDFRPQMAILHRRLEAKWGPLVH